MTLRPVNRVLLTFKTWDEKKNELQPHSQAADQRTLDLLQLQHLREAKHRLRDNVRPDEQPFMALLNNQVQRLEKKLYPNLIQRFLMQLKDRLFDGPAYLKQQADQRAANMENLKQQLQEKGLSSVAGKLEDHLNPDHKQACLPLDCLLRGGRSLEYDLWFEKDEQGNFQLTRLDGSLKDKIEPIKSYEFEFKDWPGLQANQVLNLLEGRALKQDYVDATGRETSRWVELGANGPHHYAPHSYDHYNAIGNIMEITANMDDLSDLLELGQLVPTYWKRDGQLQEISVQADPGKNGLKFFDAKGKEVTEVQLNQRAAQMAKSKKPEPPAPKQTLGKKNGHRVHA
ncbi:MAG TPA: hypothetical protein VIM55_10130 [Mucilaginibacter sp.]